MLPIRKAQVDPTWDGTGNPHVIWWNTGQLTTETFPIARGITVVPGDFVGMVEWETPGKYFIGFVFGADLGSGNVPLAGPGYGGTTASAIVMAAGSQTIVTEAGLAYQVGARIRISSLSNPSNQYIEGIVTDYTGSSLTFLVSADDPIVGSTFSDGRINVAGEVGDDGESPNLTIGTVDTGPADAEIVGDFPDLELNLTIPAGEDGEAATISIGTVTTGAAGSSASVTNGGTPSAAVLDFVIPRGDTGAAGGTTWRTGSGAPSNALGSNDDWYVDLVTNEFYLKSAGTYSVIGTL